MGLRDIVSNELKSPSFWKAQIISPARIKERGGLSFQETDRWWNKITPLIGITGCMRVNTVQCGFKISQSRRLGKNRVAMIENLEPNRQAGASKHWDDTQMTNWCLLPQRITHVWRYFFFLLKLIFKSTEFILRSLSGVHVLTSFYLSSFVVLFCLVFFPNDSTSREAANTSVTFPEWTAIHEPTLFFWFPPTSPEWEESPPWRFSTNLLQNHKRAHTWVVFC